MYKVRAIPPDAPRVEPIVAIHLVQFPSCRAVTARLFPLLHVTFNKALPITFEANSVSTTHLTELIGLVWDTPAEYAVPLTVAFTTPDPFRNSYHGFAAAVQSANAAL